MAEQLNLEVGHRSLLEMVSEIVSSYLRHNPLPVEHVPEFIHSVHRSLQEIDKGMINPEEPALKPAVSIRRSVTPDHIICLEDGKKLKMLKRHLKTAYNMTPDEYRERWGLASDYPMVAPNYAKQRSKLAKAIGLGTRPRQSGKS